MTKARRMMQENIRLVDLVIEILDARAPVSSRNPDIDRMAQGKERLVILAREDLADPEITGTFLDTFKDKGLHAVAMDARSKRAKPQVLQAVRAATEEKVERDLRRGIRNRPVRAMICGVPNVGKSTFINTISGRTGAKTGNRPGVTTGKQWISWNGIDFLDTPGILWPRFEDPSVGMKLALLGSVRDEILDDEALAICLLDFLFGKYPEFLYARYGELSYNGQQPDTVLEKPAEDKDFTARDEENARKRQLYHNLEEIAGRKNLLRQGGEPDPERAARLLLDDFRKGRIGRISLDEPQVMESGEQQYHGK